MRAEGSFLQQFHTGYRKPRGPLEQGRTRALERLQDLLDSALMALDGGNSRLAFRLMGAPLSALRNDALALGAEEEFASSARRHPVFAIVQQDPYTRRAFEKPRGYPGDAVMLDLVYDGVPPPGTSLTGKQCFFGTTRSSMGLSVIYRRSLLRAYIDRAVASADDFRILSVASGHCRELEGSLFMETPCHGEFVAFDQDIESCERVRDVYKDFPVRVKQGQFMTLCREGDDFGAFDLIYTAGLLDHLTTPIASRLAHRLFGMLRPGGCLLLASVVPDSNGLGYMHMMMDWPLICRNETQLRDLLPSRIREQARTHLDPHGNIAYAEIRDIDCEPSS
jgi:hypothetical protein